MKKPTAQMLAMRDPALAILLGAMAPADFGAEADFGADFEGDYDFGEDNGGGGPQAWQAQGQGRGRLLNPNKGSSVKVERYTFGLTEDLVLQTASSIDTTENPTTTIRPQRITTNAPVPAFARLTDIKVANVSAIVGGQIDAFQLNANGQGQGLDLPLLSPANAVKVTGSYSGLVPTGYTAAAAFVFCVGLSGPSRMVA